MFPGNFVQDNSPSTIDLSGGGLYSEILFDPLKNNYIASNFQDYINKTATNNILEFKTNINDSFIDLSQYRGIIVNNLCYKQNGQIIENQLQQIINVKQEMESIKNGILAQMQLMYTDLLNKINANTASINSNTASISSNTQKIDANTVSITSNTQKIDANTQKISNIFGSSGYQPGVDLTTLNTKINTNTASITSNTQKIDANTASITSNTQKIDANTASITSNTNNYTSLSQRVANINTSLARVQLDINTIFGSSGYQPGVDLTMLNTKVNSNTASISSNTQKISANTQKISNIFGSSGYQPGVDLTTLNTKVNSNTTRIASNAASISSNTQKINANVANISSNTQKIDANTASISSNTQKINTNTQQISVNTQEIANLQSSSGSSSEIQTMKQDIRNNAANISSLEYTVNTHYTAISNLQNKQYNIIDVITRMRIDYVVDSFMPNATTDSNGFIRVYSTSFPSTALKTNTGEFYIVGIYGVGVSVSTYDCCFSASSYAIDKSYINIALKWAYNVQIGNLGSGIHVRIYFLRKGSADGMII